MDDRVAAPQHEAALCKALEFELELLTWLTEAGVPLPGREDALQEIYGRILVADCSNDTAAVRACLYGIAWQVASETRAQVHGLGEGERRLSPPIPPAVQPAQDAREASEAQELEALIASIGELPKLVRQILTLRKVYNIAQPDIARRLGLPLEEVERRLEHAARHLSTVIWRRRRARALTKSRRQ